MFERLERTIRLWVDLKCCLRKLMLDNYYFFFRNDVLKYANIFEPYSTYNIQFEIDMFLSRIRCQSWYLYQNEVRTNEVIWSVLFGWKAATNMIFLQKSLYSVQCLQHVELPSNTSTMVNLICENNGIGLAIKVN